MTQTTGIQFQQWVNPVAGERVNLRFDGQKTTLERGGKLTTVKPKPIDAAALAQGQANMRAMSQWNIWNVAQWIDILEVSTGSEAQAKAQLQALGFPLKLWDDVQAFRQQTGLPKMFGTTAQPAQASLTTWVILGSGDSPLPVIPNQKEIRLDDPAFRDNLLVHPTPEVKKRFEELNAPPPLNPAPPPESSAMWEQAQLLGKQGFVRLSPRRPDGSLWLPPALEPYRQKLLAWEQPVVRPAVIPGKPKLWESKFGGLPYRPKGTAWPTGRSGQLLYFLAQIDLSVVNAKGQLPDFPRKGLLQFFLADADYNYENKQPKPNFDTEVKVLYWPETIHDETALIRQSPIFADPDQLASYSPPERAMGFVQDSEIPEIEDQRLTWPQSLDSIFNEDPNDTRVPGMRVGGHPMTIYATFAPQDDWRLLFQFDGHAMENVVGDEYMLGGWLGFFIHGSDLKKLEFSHIRVELDAF